MKSSSARTRLGIAMGLAVVALACAPAEPTVGADDRAIVNGQVDPYDFGVVALTVRGFVTCSGTLVSPRVVITAAHCLESIDPTELRAQVGSRVGLADAIVVANGTVHDLYQGDVNDIAALALVAPAPAHPWPINRAPIDGASVGQDVRIAGYGVTDPNGNPDGRKREGVGRVSSFVDLEFNYVSNPSQTCFGDSGGPVFIEIEGVEYLAGVTSRGDASCAQFSVNTRIDAQQAFIDTFVATYDSTVVDCSADGTCGAGCAEPDPDCPCEFDGYCTTACERPSIDRDCPPNCESDGVCQDGAGCPVEDDDCHPTAGVGDPCRFDTNCLVGRCVAALDEPRLLYCASECAGDPDCPSGMECLPGAPASSDQTLRCRYRAPTPGAQGAPCRSDGECLDMHCLRPESGGSERICASTCISDAACAEGDECRRDPDSSQLACFPIPEEGCSCRVQGGDRQLRGRAVLAVLMIALLGAWRRRARRRA